MVLTRSGAAAAAEWRKRVISNVAPCPPQCVIANQDYYTQEDISLVQDGGFIRVCNKADLRWRTGTFVGNASTDETLSHIKQVRFFGEDSGDVETVDLFQCFWNHCGPREGDDLPPQFSTALTDEQDERVDHLFANMLHRPAMAYMFPWSNTGPSVMALRDLDGFNGIYGRDLLGFFSQAVIESSIHAERKRILVLTPMAIPSIEYFEGIPEHHTERRRRALRDYSDRLGLPSLVTADLVLIPVSKDGHRILLVADVTKGLLYTLDPYGLDESEITNAQRNIFCQAINDMWARDMLNLGWSSAYFQKATRSEERKMYSDYDLPLQPDDEENTDGNCVPLVCLYLVTIATGRKFDYGQFGPYREDMRQGMEPTDENWLDFVICLRRKIASIIAEYGDNFRFMF